MSTSTRYIRYFAVEPLSSATRADIECDLLVAYHAALLAQPGSRVPADYSLLQCFSAYQESILHLWPLQVVLVLTGTLASRDGAKLMRLMNERLCAATSDWQCDRWLDLRFNIAKGKNGPTLFPQLSLQQMFDVLPTRAQHKLIELGQAPGLSKL